MAKVEFQEHLLLFKFIIEECATSMMSIANKFDNIVVWNDLFKNSGTGKRY